MEYHRAFQGVNELLFFRLRENRKSQNDRYSPVPVMKILKHIIDCTWKIQGQKKKFGSYLKLRAVVPLGREENGNED